MPRRPLLALAAACLLLGGCGRPATNSKYRLAVIPKGLTHEFWQSIHRGAQRAADDLGKEGLPVEVLWDGPRKEDDTREQIDLVNQMIGMGIHGVVLAPQSRDMGPCVGDAVDRGIPVVIIDSGLDPAALKARPDLIVKYIATDNYNGGRLAAKHLLETLAKDGKTAPNLILFRYAVGSESTEQREQGFLDHVNQEIDRRKKADEPAITLLSTNKYAGATVDTAEKEAGPLLGACKEKMDGIFAVNESSATGMLNALRSQGLARSQDPARPVRFIGFDASEQLLQAVREGDMDGTVVQDPYRMGYLGVWTLVEHLEGYDVSAGGKDLGTGEYVVTKENLDAEATRELFSPEVQAKRTIKKPEFKKK
jgi:ribose transport system substrate-binding protein